MKRRDFLKGFIAATGTLAVAPAFAIESVEQFGVPEYWTEIENMIEDQQRINRLIAEMDYFMGQRAKRIQSLEYNEGIKWDDIVVTNLK